jgi:hypothetical protein
MPPRHRRCGHGRAVRREDVVAELARRSRRRGADRRGRCGGAGLVVGLKHRGQVPAHGSQIFVRAEGTGLEMVVARDGHAAAVPRPCPAAVRRGTGGPDEWLGGMRRGDDLFADSLETEWGRRRFADPACVCGGGSARGPGGPRCSRRWSWRRCSPIRWPTCLRYRKAWRGAWRSRRVRWRWTWRRRSGATADAERRPAPAAAVGDGLLAVWLLGIGAFWTLLNVQRGRLTRPASARWRPLSAPAREIRRLRGKVLEFAQYADRTHSALEACAWCPKRSAGRHGLDLLCLPQGQHAVAARRGRVARTRFMPSSSPWSVWSCFRSEVRGGQHAQHAPGAALAVRRHDPPAGAGRASRENRRA